MTKKYDYDLIVIGGGAAGFTASKTANGLGKKVALIEKDKLGGECTWNGCIPSKALIKASEIYHNIKNSARYGIKSDANISSENIMNHVRGVVQSVYAGHKPEVFEKVGINVLFGEPKFLDNHTITLNGKKLTANKFILATGSAPFIPKISGLDKTKYLTNLNLFEIDEIPKTLTIIGAGAIGVEMANAFTRLGTKVNVVDMAGFLVNDDKDITNILLEKLKEEGVNFYLGYSVEKVSQDDTQKFVQIKKGKEIKALQSDEILVAAGRKPNLDLDLEKAGVELIKGGVKTNKYLKTTASNIWACGDIVPPYQFSHISEYEGVKAGLNAFLPIKQSVNYDNIIWTIFTQPEISHLGLTEQQAREKYGDKIKVSTFDYKDLDRAKTEIATFGRAKFIYLPNGKILGAHILGKHSCEIINQVQTMKTLGISFYKAKNLIHSYPTYSDIIRQPAKKAYVQKILDNPIVKMFRK